MAKDHFENFYAQTQINFQNDVGLYYLAFVQLIKLNNNSDSNNKISMKLIEMDFSRELYRL